MFSTLNNPEYVKCAYPTVNETIPPSSLGYHSNSKYDGFPALMSDGRPVTASYQSDAVLNDYLLKQSNVQSNWEYRQYLIKNGAEIIKFNSVEAANDSGYYKRYIDFDSTYSSPYVYPSFVDTNKPVGYETSDLKEKYLSREQLQSRMVSPQITQEQLLQGYSSQL